MENLDHYFEKLKFSTNSYHNLMHNKINHILLVSTYYDAFIFEEDGILSEQFFGEFDQLSLGNIPRITSVPTGIEALKMLDQNEFDLVITMRRIGEISPFEMSEKIKKNYQDIPVLLLLNMESDIEYLNRHSEKMECIDDVFLWNGDSKIFLAMIKHVEDRMNVDRDTKDGLVNVILLVEDSVRYYSRFLPILYTEIMNQTQRLISAELSIVNKRRRMRVRPKVLLVHNYEDAVEIIERYRDELICVISDVKYPKNGDIDELAGMKLMQKIKQENLDIALMLQSSEVDNTLQAVEFGANFLHKNSETLLLDLRKFILQNLGFGDLIFKNNKNEEVARASNMLEFEALLPKIPADSILYHAKRNNFSAWLIAHGEIKAARKLKPMQVESFEDPEELREFLFSTFKELRLAKNKGKVIEFDSSTIDPEGQIIRLCEGSLGGKGRGLAFLNSLIHATEMDNWYENITIRTPKTFIIGTNEFDAFMEKNKIKKAILNLNFDRNKMLNNWHDKDDAVSALQKINASDVMIENVFLKGELSWKLQIKLKQLLRAAKYPLAVRSSGLLEDSQSQPFAGVYNTYMLTNSDESLDVRLKKLMDAIKKVFASIYLKDARQYIRNINYKVEEEKMAVIIQNIVGSNFEGLHYPHISGVAQSYNYYPTSYLKSSDGIATFAIGLGKSVVDGESVYLFSPRHPKLEILPMEKMIRNNQKKLYAVNLNADDENCEDEIVQVKLRDLRDNGSLEHLVSVWDHENNSLKVGLHNKGPLIVNFPNILKHGYFPLGEILSNVLEICKKAMGVPVEIEFAVKLSKDLKKENHIFYLLQIRPMKIQTESVQIDPEKYDKNELLLFSEHAMGNGVIENIQNVVVFDQEKFDNTKTEIMQQEIEAINETLKNENKPYLLIGPGRWGSRDRFLGIPVMWSQISNAKAIVEVGIEGFNVDASQGTHFFHNLMSMNVGYFSVPFASKNDFLDLDWLMCRNKKISGDFFHHMEFDKPLEIKIDGKNGIAVIVKP